MPRNLIKSELPNLSTEQRLTLSNSLFEAQSNLAKCAGVIGGMESESRTLLYHAGMTIKALQEKLDLPR